MRKRAVQLRELLTKLGPSFVKVGQALSSRPDLLPKPYLEVFIHSLIHSFIQIVKVVGVNAANRLKCQTKIPRYFKALMKAQNH